MVTRVSRSLPPRLLSPSVSQDAKSRHAPKRFLQHVSSLQSSIESSPASVTTPSLWAKNLRGEEWKRDGPSWFTGKPVELTPGFRNGALRSLELPSLTNVTAELAQNYFDNSWTLSELLFSGLSQEESFYVPPNHGLRHPMAFYYVHPAAFYVNKSVVAGLLSKSIDPVFERQFEVGVDEMRWDDLPRPDRDWPAVSEMTAYRRRVYEEMTALVKRELDSRPRKIDQKHPLWSFFMACDHDRIHLETSNVLIRELPLRFVSQPKYWPEPAAVGPTGQVDPRTNPLIRVKGERIRLGKDLDTPTYGWDNEYGSLSVDVPSFSATKDKVTNREFLAFVAANGYNERQYWSEDGWKWKRFRNAQHPQYWIPSGPRGSNQFGGVRTTFTETQGFPLEWPVSGINALEAEAYCNWLSSTKSEFKGARLPTESEYALLSETASPSYCAQDPALKHDGHSIDATEHLNLALAHGSERCVGEGKVNGLGFRDVRGNAWEWTSTMVEPLPGFKAHPYYADFTEPCFDGKHAVIKGGSYVTSGGAGASPYARFHFRQHFMQNAGFRVLVPTSESAGSSSSTANSQQTQADYESAKMVEQYMHFAFADVDAGLAAKKDLPLLSAGRGRPIENFNRYCAEVVLAVCKPLKLAKPSALDIGCAVGGTAIALSQGGFQRVVGLDLSEAFVREAIAVRDSLGKVQILGQEVDMKLDPAVMQRIEFRVGDAMNLDKDLEQEKFDAVIAGNLLCRLPDPEAFLTSLPRYVRPGGVVVLASPFSWMESFTPKEKWLGATQGEGHVKVQEIMERLGFTAVFSEDQPFMMREHPRKYQFVVANVVAFVYGKAGKSKPDSSAR